MGPVVFSLSLKPGLKDFQSELDGERIDAFAYTGNIALVHMRVVESMVRAIPPLRVRARRNRHRCQTHRRRGATSGRASSDGGRVLAADQLSTSKITEKGRVQVVGVPLGRRPTRYRRICGRAHVAERAVGEAVREGRANCGVHRLVGRPDKQAVAFLPSFLPSHRIPRTAGQLPRRMSACFRWEHGWRSCRMFWQTSPVLFMRPSEDGGSGIRIIKPRLGRSLTGDPETRDTWGVSRS